MTLSALVDPAFFTHPPFGETLGPEVADLAALAGFAPDPEQALALDAMFALGGDGRSAAFEFAVVCPRQNLKTGLLKMAALGWLFVTDQKLIVWSAHEMRTTREAFRDLTNLIVNCPPLRKRLAGGVSNGIMSGNGNESIELAPTPACPEGQRILFKARTNGGGRGLTGDKVILDVAFALKASHMGSLLPTLSARPDPQVVYASSAGLADSEILRSIRDRGRKGDPSLAYMEFCAPDGVCADERCSHLVGVEGCGLDEERWVRMANPAIGRRISLEHIIAERRALPPREFARERLGWWDEPDISEGPLISADAWSRLTDVKSQPVDPVAFSVYVNKSQTSAAIGVAGYRSDGRTHVGVVPAVSGQPETSLPGLGWIPGRVAELCERWGPCAVVIDERSEAGSLIDDLASLGVAVTKTNATAMANACGSFLAAVKEGDLRHQGSASLAASVTAGKRRDLADAWAWDRKDPGSDITQLVAVTLAMHGVLVHGRPRETEVWGFWT